MLILLVDDSELALAPAKACLERGNLQVVTATSDEQALELAGRLQPDLIVLFELPTKSTETLCRRLKEDPRTASTQVLSLGVHHESVMDNVSMMLGISPRRHVRMVCRFTVGISESGQVYEGVVENVSEGGMLLTTDTFFAPDTILRLRFKLPKIDKELSALGRVVQTQEAGGGNYGFGIEFADMDASTRQSVIRLFEQTYKEATV